MSDVAQVIPHKGGVRGGPKTPGSGRKPGSRNRVTREIAEIAQRHGKSIVQGLMKEFRSTDDVDLKIKIGQLVLSYGYGQPTRRSEVSGPDGSPIQRQDMIIHASERVAAAFADVVDADDPAEQLNDESLRSIQAISFVTAKEAQARELGKRGKNEEVAQAHQGVDTPNKTGEGNAGVLMAPEPLSDANQPSQPVKPEPPESGATLSFLDSGLRIVGLKPSRSGLPPVYALHGSAGLMRRGNWETMLASARKHAGGDDLGPFVVQQPQQQIQPSRPDQKPFARRP